MTPESMNALKLIVEADAFLVAGEVDAGARAYAAAIAFAEETPDSDPLFDKELMTAYCNAGLSHAYCAQEMFLESLASADQATEVLARKLNPNSRSYAERLLMAATAKIRALVGLGCLDEAKLALAQARIVLAKSNALSMSSLNLLTELAKELELCDTAQDT